MNIMNKELKQSIKENITYLNELFNDIEDEEILIEIRNQIKYELNLLKTRIFTDLLGEIKND